MHPLALAAGFAHRRNTAVALYASRVRKALTLCSEGGNQTRRECFPNTRKRTHNRKFGVLLDDGFDLLLVFLDRRPQQLKFAHDTLYKDCRAVHHGTILRGW